jgi:hypothetical protein
MLLILVAHVLFSVTTLASLRRVRRQDLPLNDQCPENWQFDLTSFHGPGCPDSSPTYNRTGYFSTSQAGGSHFSPGCETQWMWFDLPWMHASLSAVETGEENKTWCEAKIKYTEMRGTFAPFPVKEPKWRLKMHKNGTTVETRYELGDGVKAVWTVQYSPTRTVEGPKVCSSSRTLHGMLTWTQFVDDIAVHGPLHKDTARTSRLDWSADSVPSPQWTAAECGTATFTMRVDLELKSEVSGGKGQVSWKKMKWSEDRDAEYGALVGISFDWEACSSQ